MERYTETSGLRKKHVLSVRNRLQRHAADDIIVENGNPSVLHLKIKNNNGFTALLSQDDKVNVSIHMQTLSAPVLSGETVGEVRAYINDEKIYSLPITAANTIKEKNYVFYLKQLLKRLIFIDKS